MLSLSSNIYSDLQGLARLGTQHDGSAECVIWQRTGRHCVALLSSYPFEPFRGVGSLFLKAKGNAQIAEDISLKREKQFYELRDVPPPVRSAVPPLHFVDAPAELMVYRGFADASSLFDIWGKGDAMSLSSAEDLGQVSAALHNWTPNASDTLPIVKDPTMTYGHITPEQFQNGRGRFDLLLKFVHISPTLNTCFRELSWRANAVTHGDFKIDNVLIDRSSVSTYVIDWELFGVGDPGWDCGSLIGSACHAVLHHAAYSEDRELSETFLWEWIKTYLNAYQSYRSECDLDRIMGYAAYWLVNRAQIELAQRTFPTETDVKLIRFAHNIVGV